MNYRDVVTTELCKKLFDYVNNVLVWKAPKNKLSRVIPGAKVGTITKKKDKDGRVHKPYMRTTLHINNHRYSVPIPSLVWIWHGNTIPPKFMIDHINGDTLDNSIGNLRCVTNQQNGANRGKQTNNTSGYKGVCKNKKGGWEAKLSIYNAQCLKNKNEPKTMTFYIGYYKTKEEAARAYDEVAREWFGEFGQFNFPLEKEYPSMRWLNIKELHLQEFELHSQQKNGNTTFDVWYQQDGIIKRKLLPKMVPLNRYGWELTVEEHKFLNGDYSACVPLSNKTSSKKVLDI